MKMYKFNSKAKTSLNLGEKKCSSRHIQLWRFITDRVATILALSVRNVCCHTARYFVIAPSAYKSWAAMNHLQITRTCLSIKYTQLFIHAYPSDTIMCTQSFLQGNRFKFKFSRFRVDGGPSNRIELSLFILLNQLQASFWSIHQKPFDPFDRYTLLHQKGMEEGIIRSSNIIIY